MQWNLQFVCKRTFWTRWWSQHCNSKLLRRLKLQIFITNFERPKMGHICCMFAYWCIKYIFQEVNQDIKCYLGCEKILNGFLRIPKLPISANSILCIFTCIHYNLWFLWFLNTVQTNLLMILFAHLKLENS